MLRRTKIITTLGPATDDESPVSIWCESIFPMEDFPITRSA
jgi:pyruvate kinase